MNVPLFLFRRLLNKAFFSGRRAREDAMAMGVLAPLSHRYLPWSRASMRPSGLVAVLNDIVIRRRRKIVECKSGISTFYISRFLKDSGGHLYTIEHNESWANLLGDMLDQEGLSQTVTAVFPGLFEMVWKVA
jgi:hypothetical protein